MPSWSVAPSERGAVRDLWDDEPGDGLVLRRGRGDGKLRERIVRALDDAVDLGDVDALIEAAEDARKVLVDLENHEVRLVENAFGDAGGTGEVEVPVPVHRRDAHHGDVYREEMAVIRHEIAEDHGNEIAQPPVAQAALVGREVPAVIEKVLARRVALDGPDRTKAEIAADLDVVQFITPLGEGGVQQRREGDVGGIVHPVAAFDEPNRLGGRAELGMVFGKIVHVFTSEVLFREGAGDFAHALDDGFRAGDFDAVESDDPAEEVRARHNLDLRGKAVFAQRGEDQILTEPVDEGTRHVVFALEHDAHGLTAVHAEDSAGIARGGALAPDVFAESA